MHERNTTLYSTLQDEGKEGSVLFDSIRARQSNKRFYSFILSFFPSIHFSASDRIDGSYGIGWLDGWMGFTLLGGCLMGRWVDGWMAQPFFRSENSIFWERVE